MTNVLSDAEKLAFAETFLGAIESGDTATVRACYAPDAAIWHNHDGVTQTVDENMAVLGWFIAKLPDRHYRLVRRVALPDGFLQQHVLEATLPDGTHWEMPACVIVRIEDGRITRLDEYLDSAHANALRAIGR